MNSHSPLKFYLTPSHDCSYLSDQEARTLFVDPSTKIGVEELSFLGENGFRRSGDYLYRPHCELCSACKSLRIPVKQFTPSRSQKRVKKTNSTITTQTVPLQFYDKHYQLYERYINERHKDGDMYPADEEQYRTFLMANLGQAELIEFYIQDTLVAVSLLDRLEDALSAVYTFYSPNHEKYSLGTYVILWQIEHAFINKLQYLYLGYFVEGCSKMNYKVQFKPCHIFENQQWRLIK